MKINRAHIYYQRKEKSVANKEKSVANKENEIAVIEMFNKNRKEYGTRRLKVALELQGICLSRRKIGEIMLRFGLKSSYTKKNFKP
ncbi:transposase [Erysipelotrichaceae bacterium]|nr:transposase [Erysipelotrichaceae bacterium]